MKIMPWWGKRSFIVSSIQRVHEMHSAHATLCFSHLITYKAQKDPMRGAKVASLRLICPRIVMFPT